MTKRIQKRCMAALLALSMTIPMFTNLNVYAKDKVVDSFYILDEEGNPIEIEITQSDLDSYVKEKEIYGLVTADETTEDGEQEPPVETEEVIGIVRFNRDDSTINYKEADTGRSGYISPNSTADAAYLGTQGEDILCYVSGVKMIVDRSDVASILPYKTEVDGEEKKELISYYYVGDQYLLHNYTYFNSGSDTKPNSSTTRVGLPPSYLKKGPEYYSYDGHYFYTEFETMIEDYKNDTRANSVNPNNPYYNYYQYLSFHTTAIYEPEEYDTYVQSKKSEDSGSVMRNSGENFVKAQNRYIINAMFMFGIAINESGWGTSKIAKDKNNLFGLGATDSNPYENAYSYESTLGCIEAFAYDIIHTGYLDGSNYRYYGPHMGDKHSGINVKYSSDPYWGEKSASRPYYFDENNKDYGRFTLGIALKGSVNLYKEADTSSKIIYTSETSNGGDVFDYPVVILDKVTGSNGTDFYKIISDMSLLDDRSGRDVAAEFKPSRDYVYVKASDIKVVFEGTGENTVIPDPEEERVFPDADPERYSYDAIEWAYEQGITTGNNGYFKPFDNCTREEVVTFLWRTMGKPAPEGTESPFPDVKDNYAYDAILWAAENKITTGDNGKFRPEDNCTREEVMTFIWRTAGKPKPAGTEKPFADVKDNYAYDAVLWAAENKITTGDNGKFRPEDKCTREEVVTFLYRAFAE